MHCYDRTSAVDQEIAVNSTIWIYMKEMVFSSNQNSMIFPENLSIAIILFHFPNTVTICSD